MTFDQRLEMGKFESHFDDLAEKSKGSTVLKFIESVRNEVHRCSQELNWAGAGRRERVLASFPNPPHRANATVGQKFGSQANYATITLVCRLNFKLINLILCIINL